MVKCDKTKCWVSAKEESFEMTGEMQCIIILTVRKLMALLMSSLRIL